MNISLSPQIEAVLQRLEELEDGFAVESMPEWSARAAKDGTKTVRLWQVPRTTGQLLYSLVLEHKPQSILELGTSAGYSAIWVGAAAAQYGGSVATIDSSSLKVYMARDYIAEAGLADTVKVIHSPIGDALERPAAAWEWNTPIDMVFLDADKKNYLRFFEFLEPHLSPQAIIVADDAIKIRHAMENFIERLSDSSEYEMEILEQDHGVLIAQRTMK